MEVINCRRLRAPPDALLERYTGLSPQIEKAFFDIPENSSAFEDAFRAIKRTIRRWDFAEGADLNIPVACHIGCHRSVAMAERIAKKISLWENAPWKVKVYVVHHTLAQVMKRYRHCSQANYQRYEGLKRMTVIGNDKTVRRQYRHGVAYNDL